LVASFLLARPPSRRLGAARRERREAQASRGRGLRSSNVFLDTCSVAGRAWGIGGEMSVVRCSVLFVAVTGMALVSSPPAAQAQAVTVEGQGQYGQPPPPPPPSYGQPTYGQPYGYGQPTYGGPPTYGPPTYGQPYGQPQYPGYAPTYAAPTRRVRYEQRETSIKGLWIPGIIVFGVSYALTSSVATLSADTEYVDYSFIPLVGPWLMVGTANNDDEVAGAIVSGLAQTAGVLMFA